MKLSDNDTLSRRAGLRGRLLVLSASLCAALGSLTVTVQAAYPPGAPAAEPAAPVIRVSREFETADVAVPYARRTVYDDTKYSDEREVTQAGRDGLVRETYIVVLKDGAEAERFTIARRDLAESVDEITTVGSIPGSRLDSRGYYIWPTTGVISSGYGKRSIPVGSSDHKGLDIATPEGTEVRAADGGQVIYAQDSGKSGYGNLIKLLHDDGSVTYYAHLSRIDVAVGDRVAQGDHIALSGATGNVTGPHLHFEIRPDGETPADPAAFLEGKPEKTVKG